MSPLPLVVTHMTDIIKFPPKKKRERLKIDPIAKFNLDKPRYETRSKEDTKSKVRKDLEKRIATDIPNHLLHDNPHPTARFIPTEQQKRMVWQMAAMGASESIIKLAVINPNTGEPLPEMTLHFHFKEIMQHAREQANFTVALKIYELAVGSDAIYDNQGNLVRPAFQPNLDALKWWDRTRGEAKRMHETRRVALEEEGKGSVTLIIENS